MPFRIYNQIPCLPCKPGYTGPTGSTGTIFRYKLYDVEPNMTGIIGPTGIEFDVGDVDDGNFEISLPFPVTFLNNVYNKVYIGSNSYLTFEFGSNVFFNLNGFNPPYPGLLINANDNSIQKYYLETSEEDTKFTISFEGCLNKYATPGLEWVWQVSFYKDSSRVDIAWVNPDIINANGIAGIFKISSGSGSVQDLPKTEGGLILTPQELVYKNIRFGGNGISTIFNNDIRMQQTGQVVGNLNIQPLQGIYVDSLGNTTRMASSNVFTIVSPNISINTTTSDNKCGDIYISTLYADIELNTRPGNHVIIARPRFIVGNSPGYPGTLYMDDNRFLKISE